MAGVEEEFSHGGLDVFKSPKFWIPVIISILITVLASLYVTMGLMAGGAHGKPSSTGLGTLLFPFAHLGQEISGGLGLVVLLSAFLGQFPVYGTIAGYGNFNGKVKPVLLGLFCIHLFFYFIASYIGNGTL